MAGIEGGADDRIGASADAAHTGVALGAQVVIIAHGTVGQPRIGAQAGGRITRAAAVALIGCGAHDKIASGAHASLTAIGLGGEVSVVTRGTVGQRRIGAQAGGRITRAAVVALIGRGADYGISTGARAAHTGVGLGAQVVIIARGTVGEEGRVGAEARGRIAHARVVALIRYGADDGNRSHAETGHAGVTLRAEIIVAA